MTAYARAVVKGREPAGPHVRDACARHLRDRKDGRQRGLKWDLPAAKRAIEFFGDVLFVDKTAADGPKSHDGEMKPFVLLPWEDADAYGDLLDALVDEHSPKGPTEEHLVEELAGVLWRKRRLRMAEGAAYQHGLSDALDPHGQTVEAAVAHLDVKDPV